MEEEQIMLDLVGHAKTVVLGENRSHWRPLRRVGSCSDIPPLGRHGGSSVQSQGTMQRQGQGKVDRGGSIWTQFEVGPTGFHE